MLLYSTILWYADWVLIIIMHVYLKSYSRDVYFRTKCCSSNMEVVSAWRYFEIRVLILFFFSILFLCIRLEQFNDVLHQENILNYDMSHPLFDLTALQTIQTEKCISVDIVQVCGVRFVCCLLHVNIYSELEQFNSTMHIILKRDALSLLLFR